MPNIIEEKVISVKKISSVKNVNIKFIINVLFLWAFLLTINFVIYLPALLMSEVKGANLPLTFAFPLIYYVLLMMSIKYISLISAISLTGVIIFKNKPNYLVAVISIIVTAFLFFYADKVIVFGYSNIKDGMQEKENKESTKPFKIILINENFTNFQSKPVYQATYKIFNQEKKSGKLRLNCQVFKQLEYQNPTEIILSNAETIINLNKTDKIVTLNSPINSDFENLNSLISDNKKVFNRCFMDLNINFGLGNRSTSWPFQLVNIDPNVKRLDWQQIYNNY